MITSFKEWSERRMLLERNAITMYHGTTTGPNNEKLQAFMNQGIQPMSGSGHGQGDGFYLFTNFNKAAEHAQALMTPIDPNHMFSGVGTRGTDTVSGSDHGGAPMVITLQDVLNPQEYVFDLELNAETIFGYLKNYWQDINQALPVQHTQQVFGGMSAEGGAKATVYHIAMLSEDPWRPSPKLWMFYVDPKTLNPIDQKRIQYGYVPSEQPLEKWKDYAEFNLAGESTMAGAEQIHTFLQAVFEKAPQLKKGFDQINRSAQKAATKNTYGPYSAGKAIKYIGTQPKQPTQIQVFSGNQWIDARQYLAPQQPEPEPVDDPNDYQDNPNEPSLLPAPSQMQQTHHGMPQKRGLFSRWFKRQPQQPVAAMRK